MKHSAPVQRSSLSGYLPNCMEYNTHLTGTNGKVKLAASSYFKDVLLVREQNKIIKQFHFSKYRQSIKCVVYTFIKDKNIYKAL